MENIFSVPFTKMPSYIDRNLKDARTKVERWDWVVTIAGLRWFVA